MATYEQWLEKFIQGKEKLASYAESATHAVHSITRYRDPVKNCLWETGFTYTGRLVVRSGQIAPDGTNVAWSEWETRHDVELPRGLGTKSP